MSITDPTDIADLQVWLDAEDETTITFGTGIEVLEWADKSGNGYVFDDAFNSGIGPDRVAGGLNGKHVIHYDNSGGDERLVSQDAALLATTQPYTFFVVCQWDNTPTSGFATVWESDGGPYMGRRNDGSYPLYTDAGGSPSYPTNTFAVSNATPYIITIQYNDAGNDSLGRRDGVEQFSGISLGGADIGTLVYAGSGLGQEDGFIAEFIIYDRALTATEILDVERYLRHKWFPTTDPTGLIEGCTLWLDFDDAASLTVVSDEITNAEDKSGSGFDQIVLGGGAGPDYAPATLNGRGVAIWPGIGLGLRNTSFAISQPYTVFMIIMFAGTLSSGVEDMIRGANDRGLVYHPVNSGSIFVLGTASPPFPDAAYQIDADTPYYTTVVFDGASSHTRLNGAVGFTGVNVGSEGMTAPVNLGRRAGSENGLGGMPGSYIGEVIIYDTALSGGDIDLVEDYLIAKWFTEEEAAAPVPFRQRIVFLN